MNTQRNDNFFAPMNITLDCTECGHRKLALVPLLELGQYQPINERGKLVYKGVCTLCKNRAQQTMTNRT